MDTKTANVNEVKGEAPKKKIKWAAIWDKFTTGLLIALMASPVLILLYIFLWFVLRNG